MVKFFFFRFFENVFFDVVVLFEFFLVVLYVVNWVIFMFGFSVFVFGVGVVGFLIVVMVC